MRKKLLLIAIAAVIAASLPVMVRAAKRAPHSRMVYNLYRLPDACDMLSQKYGDRIDATLKRAMDNYRKTMTLLYQSDVARTYRRSGQYGRYFAFLVAKPDLARRLFSRSAIRIGKLLRQIAAR